MDVLPQAQAVLIDCDHEALAPLWAPEARISWASL
jgi:hypothetical protein